MIDLGVYALQSSEGSATVDSSKTRSLPSYINQNRTTCDLTCVLLAHRACPSDLFEPDKKMLSLSFNEAARRGTWTCLACSTMSRVPQALITNSSGKHSGSKHQRNHSSSKASSSSKDEARPITSASDATSKDTTNESQAEKRSSSRRLSKEVSKAANKSRNETNLNIPSVPSTQHLHPYSASSFRCRLLR